MTTFNACPHCHWSSGGCNGKCMPTHPPFEAFTQTKGCICPPTSEQTCKRFDCGRKSNPVSATGIATYTE